MLGTGSYLLLACLSCCLGLMAVKRLLAKRRRTQRAPGPRPWPVLGSLHLLARHQDLPYKAFHRLAQEYGPVVSLRLGQVDCVVVSTLETVKEVLINKGEHFDSRPDFPRFNNIFGGNKDNSLAFCDWSDLQKARREMLRDHTFPRAFSSKFYQLESIVNTELAVLTDQMSKTKVTNIKPLILHACANVFLSYFSSIRFQPEDDSFREMLKNFDLVFYEVNQGYASDFMPWLNPLQIHNTLRTRKWGKAIREFMHERVVRAGGQDGDLLHVLLANVSSGGMNVETAMFAFEDIIGGHCAVGNFLVKILAFIARYPAVQSKMQEEVDAVTCGKTINLGDRLMMPYTEAVILECIRHICSPIVPHVASQDTTINDYQVDKGTLIFLNNYTLNMSPDLWSEPERFAPERFITEEGSLLKPEHFLPFGGGRRSCMGYKMTQYVSFATLATLMQRYTVAPLDTTHVALGNLALPYTTVNFNFLPRT